MDDLESPERTIMRLRDQIEERTICKFLAMEFEGNPCVAKRHQWLSTWQLDRIEKSVIPRHAAAGYTSRSVS
jgi:hypothetical protein